MVVGCEPQNNTRPSTGSDVVEAGTDCDCNCPAQGYIHVEDLIRAEILIKKLRDSAEAQGKDFYYTPTPLFVLSDTTLLNKYRDSL